MQFDTQKLLGKSLPLGLRYLPDGSLVPCTDIRETFVDLIATVRSFTPNALSQHSLTSPK
jgi:hypothetical protein